MSDTSRPPNTRATTMSLRSSIALIVPGDLEDLGDLLAVDVWVAPHPGVAFVALHGQHLGFVVPEGDRQVLVGRAIDEDERAPESRELPDRRVRDLATVVQPLLDLAGTDLIGPHARISPRRQGPRRAAADGRHLEVLARDVARGVAVVPHALEVVV